MMDELFGLQLDRNRMISTLIEAVPVAMLPSRPLEDFPPADPDLE